MIIGVVSFSFANGALASMLTSNDQHNSNYNEKLKILNTTNKDYKLPNNLYISILRHIRYESKQTVDDLDHFAEHLP